MAIFLHKNIFDDPSLEPSHRDRSNEGSQHMFLLRNKKLSLTYPHYTLLSGALIRLVCISIFIGYFVFNIAKSGTASNAKSSSVPLFISALNTADCF